jgi:hypothetical protein
MIKVYTKTAEEVRHDEVMTSYAKSVGGFPKGVCPTYVYTMDGKKVDTWDLSPKQVFDLLSNELSVNGPKVQCDDFLRSLKSGFKFPLSGVVAFLELRGKSKYPGIVSDMMVPFCVDTLSSAREIAKFNKECNGDYSSIVDNDLITIIKQMRINELNKNNKRSNVRR